MPIYCEVCPVHGYTEYWESIKLGPRSICPDCGWPVQKIITVPGGMVMEPHGVYVPVPGLDKNGKMNEIKISPRENARNDDQLRARMLNTRARAKKQGLTIQPGEKRPIKTPPKIFI